MLAAGGLPAKGPRSFVAPPIATIAIKDSAAMIPQGPNLMADQIRKGTGTQRSASARSRSPGLVRKTPHAEITSPAERPIASTSLGRDLAKRGSAASDPEDNGRGQHQARHDIGHEPANP